MQGTIATTLTATYVLSVNPTTILSTGAVSVTSASYGVTGGPASTLINAGRITSHFFSGVSLGAGSMLTNAASGTITTDFLYGVLLGGGGTVTNAGSIGGTTGNVAGINLLDGGTVHNQFGGSITAYFGAAKAIRGVAAPATIANAGRVEGYGGGASGIALYAGGSITNLSGGLITATGGGANGILLGAGGNLTNSSGGTISSNGGGANGILLEAGGTVSNLDGATIASQLGVLVAGGAAMLYNAGLIDGQYGVGVAFSATYPFHVPTNATLAAAAAGAVVNSGLIISRYHDAISFQSGLANTVINSGSIISQYQDAISFQSGLANRLVAEPGGVFQGTVNGGGALSTLELGSATSTGTLTGLGTEFINFGTIAFDAGANWVVTFGSNGFPTTIDGFAGGDTIFGFGAGDTVDLPGITVTGSTYANGILTLTEGTGSTSLNLPGPFPAPGLIVTNTPGGAQVTVACFLKGTNIRASMGDIPVERLCIGDHLETFLRAEAAPITWIGERTIDCARHPWPDEIWPIRIRAGTFGSGLPERDLFLSPDHAVYINEVLIPVKHLINNGNIARIPMDVVSYYHVELPRHDVVWSDGLPTESYLDTGDRSTFANVDGAIRLFPRFSVSAQAADAFREANGCAPLVVAGPELESARRQVSQRARRVGIVTSCRQAG